MFKVSTCIAAGFALATGAAAVPACADVGSIACTVFLRPSPLDRIAHSLLGSCALPLSTAVSAYVFPTATPSSDSVLSGGSDSDSGLTAGGMPARKAIRSSGSRWRHECRVWRARLTIVTSKIARVPAHS